MLLKKALITGGAGAIGYHLAQALLRDDIEELALVDNLSRGTLDQNMNLLLQDPRVRFINADLTKAESFSKLGRDYDEVYHLAGVLGVRKVVQQSWEAVYVNTMATLLLLDWLASGGGKKILFTSTSEVYSWTAQFHPLPIPTPEEVPLSLTDLNNPRSAYAGSKILCELAVTRCALAYQLPFVILRYHNVYGPRMGFEHVIPELYMRICKGENPLTVYSADHRRAFCYISDAVEATILAMRRATVDGNTFNVGNDLEEITIGDLAQRIMQEAGYQAVLDLRENAQDQITRRCPDITRARQLLGYNPKVGLEEGLRITLAWYNPKLISRIKL